MQAPCPLHYHWLPKSVFKGAEYGFVATFYDAATYWKGDTEPSISVRTTPGGREGPIESLSWVGLWVNPSSWPAPKEAYQMSAIHGKGVPVSCGHTTESESGCPLHATYWTESLPHTSLLWGAGLGAKAPLLSPTSLPAVTQWITIFLGPSLPAQDIRLLSWGGPGTGRDCRFTLGWGSIFVGCPGDYSSWLRKLAVTEIEGGAQWVTPKILLGYIDYFGTKVI